MNNGLEKMKQMLYDTFVVPIRDFRVFGWTVLLGLLAWFIDPQGAQVISVCFFVFFFWSFAVCVRKVLFPYRTSHDVDKRIPINLSDYFKEALKGNIAAAIVVASQVFFMCMVALTFVLWVRP